MAIRGAQEAEIERVALARRLKDAEAARIEEERKILEAAEQEKERIRADDQQQKYSIDKAWRISHKEQMDEMKAENARAAEETRRLTDRQR